MVRAPEPKRTRLRSGSYKAREKLGLEKMGAASKEKENGAVSAVLTGTEESSKPPSLPRLRREVRGERGIVPVLCEQEDGE